MKKYRLFSSLLALALSAGLLLPAALAAESTAVTEPAIAATAWLLMDGDHDEVLLEHAAEEQRFPASITKVMTALLTLEAVDQGKLALTDMITATEAMERDLSDDGSTQGIKPGEAMSVNDLLHCLLITSANEAANILGIAVAGDLDTFVDMMNSRAKALGCTGTNFSNAHGLHNPGHYTTAHDVYRFSREAMKNPTFREIVGMKAYTVPATNLHPERGLHATNALISTFRIANYYYKYATGIKTGSTPEAGQCLVSSAEKNGRTLYAVVMGAENVKLENGDIRRDSFGESEKLLEWGFNNTERKVLLDETFFGKTLPVTLSSGADYVGLEPTGTLEATLPKGLDPAKFDQMIETPETSLVAPVVKGQVLGSVTVSYEGKVYGTVPLVAVADVERSELLYRLDQIKQFADQLWVKLVALGIALVAAFFLLRWMLLSKRRRYGARGVSKRSGYTGRKK